jgi:uncharacterized protein
MSADGSKLRDVTVLADEGAIVPVELAVRSLPRLLPELAAESGVARGELRFLRDLGVPAADVRLEAQLTLICQRCLRPVQQTVTSESRVYFPQDEAGAARLPVDVEVMLAPEGRLRVADIVAEDLLLALPLAPRHEEDASCSGDVATAPDMEPAQDEEVRRPFAALGELMGRELRREDDSGRPPQAPRTRR